MLSGEYGGVRVLGRPGIFSIPRDAQCVGVAKGGNLIRSPLEAVYG